MKLRLSEIKDKNIWKEQGYILPEFNIEKMAEKTLNEPSWVHFGAGNIFRAFPALVCQKLLNEGIMDTGIVVAEGYDYEILDRSIKNFDNLHIAVTLKGDGSIEKEVVASISEALAADREKQQDWHRLEAILQKESLKMISFTITEKGYQVKDSRGEYLPLIEADLNNTPEKAESYMGKVVSLLYTRYKSGGYPLTFVSMDNCSHNGTLLKEAVMTFAEGWAAKGMVEDGFKDYAETKVSYPWSMIDKITPRPAETVMKILEETGLEETQVTVTSKNTYTAPFVNGEQSQYLIIEDDFKNGKLPLDRGGIIYTDRETVDKVEKMKVCTCLNPLHTTLAVFGCLLGYEKISDEMKDESLVSLIKKIGYEEGLPVVVNPRIISPTRFIDEVINVRFPNPFVPDTPQRIACDTSQKIPVRFGETLKAYMEREDLEVDSLKYIPLVFAGWCRYLMGIDDDGKDFALSPDPMLWELKDKTKALILGNNENIHEVLMPILSDEKIFGLNLYETGLGEKTEQYFKEMNIGVGAVKTTLQKYC